MTCAENDPIVEDWVEVSFEERLECPRKPRRYPSLPALNLVTVQQPDEPEQVVDLLESPERRTHTFGRFEETPWPHSPSGSVASLAMASSTGLYIELE